MTSYLVRDLPRLCVFDLETTGTDPETDRIVTAYIALMERDGTVAHEWTWLVNPGVDIPVGATEVHGITTEHAQQNGVDAREGVAAIRDIIMRAVAAGRPITAYNSRFDLTMLERECRRYNLEPFTAADITLAIDPFVLDKELDTYRKGRRTLETVARIHGVTLDGAHDASVDAVATGQVAWAQLAQLPQDATIEAIHDMQVVAAREQAASFQDYLRRTSNPLAFIEPQWPLKDYDPEEHFVDDTL